jgi:hypothetical protein
MSSARTPKLALVHYLSIEYYPPVTNFLNFIAKKKIQCTVYTTHNTRKRVPYSGDSLNIKRFVPAENVQSRALRFLRYYLFNLKTFLWLCRQNPDIVLYYDSFSAMPVYWYLKVCGRDKRLWIHSHEYYSKESYSKSSILVRRYHRKEIAFLYDRAMGISQTNPDRVNLFLADHPKLDKYKIHFFPNYPPGEWYESSHKPLISVPVKFVYIGSLSLRNTYIKEFCNWILSQAGKARLSIYSYFIDPETSDFLKSLNTELIDFHMEGVEYYKLPGLLKNYDVGLIPFKDFDLNYRFNETNKFFEYLSANLDVWFSKDLKGLAPYCISSAYPRVSALDFQNPEEIDLASLTDHSGLPCQNTIRSCDAVFEDFYSLLTLTDR